MRWMWMALLVGFMLLGCAGPSAPMSNSSDKPFVVSAAPSSSAVGGVAPASNASASQKFSDSPDYISAHLISSESLDDSAKAALAGFELQKQVLADGRTNFTLKALSPSYSDQNYILQPGQSLYFIEKFPQDDQPDTDANLRDDSAVIVDADGYIVN